MGSDRFLPTKTTMILVDVGVGGWTRPGSLWNSEGFHRVLYTPHTPFKISFRKNIPSSMYYIRGPQPAPTPSARMRTGNTYARCSIIYQDLFYFRVSPASASAVDRNSRIQMENKKLFRLKSPRTHFIIPEHIQYVEGGPIQVP